MDILYNANGPGGLFTDNWLIKDGSPVGRAHIISISHSQQLIAFLEHYTIGATADSGYEYLLKQWIQSGDLKALNQCTFLDTLLTQFC